MLYPLVPPYGAFTKYTPVVPAFYRNIYSQEEGLKKILFELDKLAAYANELANAINSIDLRVLDRRLNYIERRLVKLEQAFESIKRGGRVRNPVSGLYSYTYVALKQMYDVLRVHSMTWRGLAATGKTWNELNNGKTYIEIDMLANTIFGDGAEIIKYTPTRGIDDDTPGFKEI